MRSWKVTFASGKSVVIQHESASWAAAKAWKFGQEIVSVVALPLSTVASIHAAVGPPGEKKVEK